MSRDKNSLKSVPELAAAEYASATRRGCQSPPPTLRTKPSIPLEWARAMSERDLISYVNHINYYE